MSWRKNLPVKRIEEYFLKAKDSPKVTLALARMDNSIRFMMDRDYSTENAAVSAVRKPVLIGLWIIMTLTLIILIWGILAPIDSAAVAKGSVVLLSSKKTVQHLEGGIIAEIYVKEGDKVKSGQKLLRLSDTSSGSNRDMILGQLYVARATEARLIAERDKLNEIEFDKDLLKSVNENRELGKVIAAQARLFKVQRQVQEAKLATLNQRIAESKEQIQGLYSQINSVKGQIGLLDEEITTVDSLLKQGHATRPRLLALQRNKEELGGNLGQYMSEVAKVQQNIIESQMLILGQQSEFETKNSEDLKNTQAQIVDLREKLRSAEDVVERTIISAPTGGIVTGLKYHTVGGVIDPGMPIMDIIPQDDQLVIEAKVKPTDIDVVHEGLDAKVIFTAYKARSTPKVPAKVTQVSADKFTEQGVPTSSYYLARVEVDKDFLKKMTKHVELYPGMPADIMIRTGSRSFISYLFSPITDSMHRAFREE